MLNDQVRILAVDDDELMRELLQDYLEDSDYALVLASSGEEAWTVLEKEGQTFDVVLLDRMMPGMDGMAVLAKIRGSEHLSHLPVIMQTAAGSPQQIKEGIEAGAFYYLVKPFSDDVLLAIVQSAVRDSLRYQDTRQELAAQAVSLGFLETGSFRVQNLEEVRALTTMLAKACPNSECVVMGLSELLLNAVEHGNLGITYEEKTHLQETGQFENEIARRLLVPDNVHKYVRVQFERMPGEIHITITDQGPGFDWQQYMEMSTDRVFDYHGRGIALAKTLSFDHLEYRGNGNEVFCVIHAQPDSIELGSTDKAPSYEKELSVE